MSEGDAPLLGYRSNQPPMVPSSPACPKCQAVMVQGSVFSAYNRSVRGRSLWVAGLIRRGFLGMVLPRGKWYEVIAFRCPACGFVEHYCPPG